MPASETDTQTVIATASPGRGSRDAPFYVYRQIGVAESFADAEAIAKEEADWDRIEIRSGCGELVAVLSKGKWHNTLAGVRPTYDGGRSA